MSKVARRAAQSLEAAEAVWVGGAAGLNAAAAVRPPAAAACARCVYREDDRHVLEQRIAGLTVFGSGFGASVATSRLCVLHDQLVAPDDRCAQFAPRR
jgi:hypothetical protein